MSTKKKVPVKKAKAAKVHPNPNPTLTAATASLETIIAEMQTNIESASSVEERQGIINRLNGVVTELKS